MRPKRCGEKKSSRTCPNASPRKRRETSQVRSAHQRARERAHAQKVRSVHTVLIHAARSKIFSDKTMMIKYYSFPIFSSDRSTLADLDGSG